MSGSEEGPTALGTSRPPRLGIGQKCPNMPIMKGRDFIKRVFEIGRERGVPARIDTERGKGSHITL